MVDPGGVPFPGVGEGGVVKGYVRGTHRLVDPGETVRRLWGLRAVFGITRVADVTGLDRIGVPVMMACRPNARTLSVSQGKGLSREAAQASALMESVECWHAEHFAPLLRFGSAEELGRSAPVADVAGLPRRPGGSQLEHLRLPWVEGTDLLSGHRVWLPHEIVGLDATEPFPFAPPAFLQSSNGLAGGNHWLEAVSHALCELVERDAVRLWQLRGGEARAETRVELATVDDPGCRAVLDALRGAGVAAGVWETTSDIPMPCFLCILIDQERDPLHPLYPAGGMGCHPDRGVALLRALTEAAQSRLTAISGARDDLVRTLYTRSVEAGWWGRVQEAVLRAGGGRDFRQSPGWWAETIDGDVQRELACLRGAGLRECILVDMTREEVGVPVVRVVVPGLEAWVPGDGSSVVLGERGRRACAQTA